MTKNPATIGESDVPLTKDIIKKEVEYVKTWVEWAADNLEFVYGQSAGAGTLYTIPENQTLFITSITISLRNAAAAGIAEVAISNPDISLITARCEAGGQATNSISYTMPLKINPPSTIISSLTGAGSFTFQGFLVPKKII